MRMLRLILLVLLAVLDAWGAKSLEPSAFYVVSVFFSDYGATYSYRVIDVAPSGPDSVIRFIRIAPISAHCPRQIVQAATATIRDTSPAQLVAGNNPCAVTPHVLKAALTRYRQRASVFEAASFGIAAQCGSKPVTFGLPIEQEVDTKRLSEARPQIGRLWELAFDVAKSAFGEKDIFQNPSDETDLAQQREGVGLIPELISGKYDTGLAAAAKGNVGSWKSPTFRAMLEDYPGPINRASAVPVARLISAGDYQFVHYEPPRYPPLAMQARIQGIVELRLTVNPATGEVTDADASDHKLLERAAVEAARKWRFTPGSASSGTISATLEFSLRCPE